MAISLRQYRHDIIQRKRTQYQRVPLWLTTQNITFQTRIQVRSLSLLDFNALCSSEVKSSQASLIFRQSYYPSPDLARTLRTQPNERWKKCSKRSILVLVGDSHLPLSLCLEISTTKKWKNLDFKLKRLAFKTTDLGKRAAMDVLLRARIRPNCGNGGEVDILLDHAKARQQRGSMSRTVVKTARVSSPLTLTKTSIEANAQIQMSVYSSKA